MRFQYARRMRRRRFLHELTLAGTAGFLSLCPRRVAADPPHEVGMIKSSPQTLIAQGTDWRFIHALKQELKG